MRIDPIPVRENIVAGQQVSEQWGKWFNSFVQSINSTFTIYNEMKLKIYKQETQPALSEPDVCAFWIDSLNNVPYFILRYNLAGFTYQKKIALT